MGTTTNTQLPAVTVAAAWPLPEELVDRIRASAYETLNKWLQAANVPDDVLDLLHSYGGLEFNAAKMGRGEPYDPREDFLGTYASAARAITALGGNFNGSEYPENVTENAQAWWKAEHQ